MGGRSGPPHLESGGSGHQIACRPTMGCQATVPLSHCPGVLSRFLEELKAWKHWQEIRSDLNQASKNGRISNLLLDKTLEALCTCPLIASGSGARFKLRMAVKTRTCYWTSTLRFRRLHGIALCLGQMRLPYYAPHPPQAWGNFKNRL